MRLIRLLKKYLAGYKQQKYMGMLSFYKNRKNMVSPANEQCPVCGYYCLGNGGHGCIDKPTLCGYDLGE